MMLSALLCMCFIFHTGAGIQCRLDWLPFEGSCYGFGEALFTWGDAEEMCRAEGGKLVEIETEEESDFLKLQARQKQGNYWIGGTDVFNEGTWTWTSTGALISPYTDWSDGEPNDQEGEDCVEISKAHNYRWNDYGCENLLNFICEMVGGEETVIG